MLPPSKAPQTSQNPEGPSQRRDKQPVPSPENTRAQHAAVQTLPLAPWVTETQPHRETERLAAGPAAAQGARLKIRDRKFGDLCSCVTSLWLLWSPRPAPAFPPASGKSPPGNLPPLPGNRLRCEVQLAVG